MDLPGEPTVGQPFSMHARGVTTYDTQQYCDLSYQFRKFWQELRDVGSSLIVMLYLQSWQSMFVVVITMSSVAFFTYVGIAGVEAELSWTLVAFVILLPLAVLVFMCFQRRESAHEDLAKVRTLTLHLVWSFEESQHYSLVKELLISLLSTLENYLNGSRFYATQYPVTDVTQRMTTIAQSRAKQTRHTLMIFANLARCPERDSVLGQQQMIWMSKLQLACEKLSIIKEYRMPQALRTLVRFYIVLIIPIFFGPYYANISNSTGSFVFVLAFAVMMHLGMVVLMNAAIGLEDPFATDGVDGIFVEEIFYEVLQILRSEVAELNGNYGRDYKHPEIQPAVPPPINRMTDHGRPDQHAVDIVSHQPLPGGESPTES